MACIEKWGFCLRSQGQSRSSSKLWCVEHTHILSHLHSQESKRQKNLQASSVHLGEIHLKPIFSLMTQIYLQGNPRTWSKIYYLFLNKIMMIQLSFVTYRAILHLSLLPAKHVHSWTTRMTTFTIFMWMYVPEFMCIHHMCAVPTKARRGQQVSRDWSYGWLGAAK